MKRIFIGFLSLVFLFAKPMFTLAKDAYAVMSPDSTTLTFYYDSKKNYAQGNCLYVGCHRFNSCMDIK